CTCVALNSELSCTRPQRAARDRKKAQAWESCPSWTIRWRHGAEVRSSRRSSTKLTSWLSQKLTTSELVRTGGRRRQHAKPHGLAGRAAQRVVTRNRLLMRTLSAVYESAPSQIPVRQRFSCAGYRDRDRCSKRPVST